MKYIDGKTVNIGDTVDIGGGMTGTVVCDFDNDKYIDGYPKNIWGILSNGVLVYSNEAGVIHFVDTSSDIYLISRSGMG